MSHTTQCPACQTKFKVTDAHLALAGGMVRCGRCNHVFHAPSHFEALSAEEPEQIELPPPAAAPVTPTAAPGPLEEDDFELELPDFQPEAAAEPERPAAPASPPAPEETPVFRDEDLALPDYDVLRQQAAPAAPAPAASSIAPDFRTAALDAEQQGGRQQLAEFEQALAAALRPHKAPEAAVEAAASNPFADAPAVSPSPAVPPVWAEEREAFEEVATDAQQAPAEEQLADAQRSGRPWWQNVLLTLLALLLLTLLLAQFLFVNRTRAAAELPELRPLLEAACAPLGCSVPLPGDRQLIRTEWSELSFIPGHDKLIQLNATLKNLATYPQKYPVLELTLKNGNDQVMVRKVLLPQQYLKAQDFKLGQFNANSEVKLQLRMEVTEGKAQGYSLDFYYP